MMIVSLGNFDSHGGYPGEEANESVLHYVT
jgi:hypothetical protein